MTWACCVIWDITSLTYISDPSWETKTGCGLAHPGWSHLGPCKYSEERGKTYEMLATRGPIHGQGQEVCHWTPDGVGQHVPF